MTTESRIPGPKPPPRNVRAAAALLSRWQAEPGPEVRAQHWVLDELVGSELIFPAAEREPEDKGVRLAFTKDRRGRVTGEEGTRSSSTLRRAFRTRFPPSSFGSCHDAG